MASVWRRGRCYVCHNRKGARLFRKHKRERPNRRRRSAGRLTRHSHPETTALHCRSSSGILTWSSLTPRLIQSASLDPKPRLFLALLGPPLNAPGKSFPQRSTIPSILSRPVRDALGGMQQRGGMRSGRAGAHLRAGRSQAGLACPATPHHHPSGWPIVGRRRHPRCAAPRFSQVPGDEGAQRPPSEFGTYAARGLLWAPKRGPIRLGGACRARAAAPRRRLCSAPHANATPPSSEA